MTILAHLTATDFPALAISYGVGIATGAFAFFVLFCWRAKAKQYSSKAYSIRSLQERNLHN